MPTVAAASMRCPSELGEASPWLLQSPWPRHRCRSELAPPSTHAVGGGGAAFAWWGGARRELQGATHPQPLSARPLGAASWGAGRSSLASLGASRVNSPGAAPSSCGAGEGAAVGRSRAAAAAAAPCPRRPPARLRPGRLRRSRGGAAAASQPRRVGRGCGSPRGEAQPAWRRTPPPHPLPRSRCGRTAAASSPARRRVALRLPRLPVRSRRTRSPAASRRVAARPTLPRVRGRRRTCAAAPRRRCSRGERSRRGRAGGGAAAAARGPRHGTHPR